MAGSDKPNARRFEVAIFDLGGVLFDFDPRARLRALAADCGRSEEDVHALVWESGLPQAVDAGRHTTLEWYEIVRDRLGLRMDFERFCDVYLGALHPCASMLELVDDVRAVTRTAILTDNPRMLLESMESRFPGVAERFATMLFSCDLGALKPSREAFTRALARLDVRAEAAFFVDDVLRNVEAARALGIDAVLFTGIGDLRGELASRGLLGDPTSYGGS